MAPLNIWALESMKAFGLDLLRDHRDDFPPEYLRQGGTTAYILGARRRTRSGHSQRGVRGDAIGARANTTSSPRRRSPACPSRTPRTATRWDRAKSMRHRGRSPDRLVPHLFANFTGHPAASIPAGFIGGLPVGMQIIGRRYADGDVLAAAAAFERVRPWKERAPHMRGTPGHKTRRGLRPLCRSVQAGWYPLGTVNLSQRCARERRRWAFPRSDRDACLGGCGAKIRSRAYLARRVTLGEADLHVERGRTPQRPPFRSGNHYPLCPVVSAVQTQLSRSRRDDG